jgi:hypothetical protein
MAKLPSARTLVLGGVAVAAAAAGAALKNRRRPSTPDVPQAAIPGPTSPEPAAPPPSVSNFDVAGPPANTSTHVPAPEPVVHDPAGGIDEDAEVAAAAAEAANIGGPMPEYAGSELDEPADEAERPLAEAGEGVSEGLEQAESDLEVTAEDGSGEMTDAEHAVLDAIEAQDDASAGERVEPIIPADAPPEPEGARAPDPIPAETLAPRTIDEGAPTGGGTLSGETASEPAADTPDTTKEGGSDDDAEWQTWSGRAVDK